MKRPVSALLAGPYGHPFHPILVTVPIGAWVTSLVFDIASHGVHWPGYRTQGSQWLIAVGVIGALLAAMVGFLDLFAIPSGAPAFRTGLVHMTLNLLVTAAYVVNFLWRYGGYTSGTSVGIGRLVLSALSVAVLGHVEIPGREARLPPRRACRRRGHSGGGIHAQWWKEHAHPRVTRPPPVPSMTGRSPSPTCGMLTWSGYTGRL
ncbi:DUF2231 domain-containing protein [Streptomyces olivaceoviridis]